MRDLYIEVLFDIVSLDRTFTYKYSGDSPEKVKVGAVVFGQIHGRKEKGWIVEVGVEPPADIRINDIDEVSSISLPLDFISFSGGLQHLFGGSKVQFVKLIDSASSRFPSNLLGHRFVDDELSEGLNSPIVKTALDAIASISPQGGDDIALVTDISSGSRRDLMASGNTPRSQSGTRESIRISPNVSAVDIVYNRIASPNTDGFLAEVGGSYDQALGSDEFYVDQSCDASPKVAIERILVIYPDLYQLDFDARRLREDGASFVVIDKTLSAKARRRFESAQIVLGTRSAIFAPIAGLSLILLVDPTSAGHKSIPNPKIDSISVGLLRSRQHGVDLLLATGFPDPTLHRVARPKGNSNDSGAWPNVRLGAITSNSHGINDQLIEWIGEVGEVDSGPLLIVYNKKGRVNRYICRKCKEAVTCEVCDTPLVYGEVYTDDASAEMAPVRRYNFSTARAEEFFDRLHARGLRCPNCHRSTPFACGRCKGTKIKVASMGSLRIADELWGIYGDRVTHVDGDSKELPQNGIVVGTSMVLNRYRRAAGVALLDVDALASQFGYASINRLYEAWYKASRILVGSSAKYPLYIGARSQEMNYVKAIMEKRPRDIYQIDLESRHEFSMPPYSFQAKVSAIRNGTVGFELVRDTFAEVIEAKGEAADLALSSNKDSTKSVASVFEISETALALVAANEAEAYSIIELVRVKIGNSFFVERYFEDL